MNYRYKVIPRIYTRSNVIKTDKTRSNDFIERGKGYTSK